MEPTSLNPYEKCPVFETEHFLFRLVCLEDARDLLSCYSDPLSAPIFNSDNCSNNFVFNTLEEMQTMIQFWLKDYRHKYYVRFSIVDRSRPRAIGTIECFARQETIAGVGKPGVLRLDLASAYENQDALDEILGCIDNNFYDCFAVQCMLTKAVPAAASRIQALTATGYRALEDAAIVPYGDYFIKVR